MSKGNDGWGTYVPQEPLVFGLDDDTSVVGEPVALEQLDPEIVMYEKMGGCGCGGKVIKELFIYSLYATGLIAAGYYLWTQFINNNP